MPHVLTYQDGEVRDVYVPPTTALTRAMLCTAQEIVQRLQNEDDRRWRARSEPGAYAHVLDQIARLMREHPDPPRPHEPAYGAPVRLRCGATGRYIDAGVGLFVSAMDNSLNLDQIDREGEPATGLPLPSDDACEAAAAMHRHLMPGVH